MSTKYKKLTVYEAVVLVELGVTGIQVFAHDGTWSYPDRLYAKGWTDYYFAINKDNLYRIAVEE